MKLHGLMMMGNERDFSKYNNIDSVRRLYKISFVRTKFDCKYEWNWPSTVR